VFVSWIGTDGNGEVMTSAGQAVSRLRQYALSPLAKSAGQSANEEVKDKSSILPRME